MPLERLIMQITTLGAFQVVDIKKPMNHGDSDYDIVRVDKRQFDNARKNKRWVLVRTPNGERIFMPKHMKDFKIDKEVFLFPDNPMLMYTLTIPHTTKMPDEYYQFGRG
jgi:hypothetical protein